MKWYLLHVHAIMQVCPSQKEFWNPNINPETNVYQPCDPSSRMHVIWIMRVMVKWKSTVQQTSLIPFQIHAWYKASHQNIGSYKQGIQRMLRNYNGSCRTYVGSDTFGHQQMYFGDILNFIHLYKEEAYRNTQVQQKYFYQVLTL